VRRRILEQQQRQRVRMLRTQVRRVLVDAIVELARDLLDALARFETDRGTAAQCARHGWLAHACQVGDVEGCWLVVHQMQRTSCAPPPFQGSDHAQAREIKATAVRPGRARKSNQRAASRKKASPCGGSSSLPLANWPSGSP